MMTYKEALDFCKSVFNASIGFQACSQLSILEHDKYIADCALDIEVRYIHALLNFIAKVFNCLVMRCYC